MSVGSISTGGKYYESIWNNTPNPPVQGFSGRHAALIMPLCWLNKKPQTENSRWHGKSWIHEEIMGDVLIDILFCFFDFVLKISSPVKTYKETNQSIVFYKLIFGFHHVWNQVDDQLGAFENENIYVVSQRFHFLSGEGGIWDIYTKPCRWRHSFITRAKGFKMWQVSNKKLFFWMLTTTYWSSHAQVFISTSNLIAAVALNDRKLNCHHHWVSIPFQVWSKLDIYLINQAFGPRCSCSYARRSSIQSLWSYKTDAKKKVGLRVGRNKSTHSCR